MTKRILLVDGVSAALQEVKEPLANLAPGWEFFYTESGLAALDALSRNSFHAIVTDLQLADMVGFHLVTQVMTAHPRIHRVILVDLGNLSSLLRCVGGVHQFLTKPLVAERLHSVLQRAFQFEIWLPSQTVRELIGRMPKLPSPTGHYSAIVRQMESASASAENVGALIASDPAMTSKILQLANSAAYGPPLDEADPRMTVMQIGLENTKGVLLLSHTYSNFRELDGCGFPIEELWSHSQITSRFARRIAEIENAGANTIQQAATAGLLHDLGKLALAANLPKAFAKALELSRSKPAPHWEAEQEVFGATHGEVGGCLLGIWGLPVPIVEAVALHHHPACFVSRSFSPLTAVHVANAFVHADTLEQAKRHLELSYLGQLGVTDRLTVWWDACKSQNDDSNNDAARK